VGEVDVRIFVEKGYITDFKIFGDFFGMKPIENIEKLLVGVKYEKDDISNILKDIDIEDYFGKLPKKEFIELVYGADIVLV